MGAGAHRGGACRKSMRMATVRLQGQEPKAMLVAGLGDRPLADRARLSGQNVPPIPRYPDDTIRDLMVRPAGLADLQGIVHTTRVSPMKRVRVGSLKHYRPKGHNWRCKVCGVVDHGDIGGAVNMYPIACGRVVPFPQRTTYRRPGSLRRCSSPGRGHRLDSSGRSGRVEARNHTPQEDCAGPLEHAHKPCPAARNSPA